DERRRKHVRASVGPGDVVIRRDDRREEAYRIRVAFGREGPFRECAEEAPEERHEERRADPFVADVGDDEADALSAAQGKGIVEVARHLPRRLKPRGDLPARRLRKLFGKEASLDLAADL